MYVAKGDFGGCPHGLCSQRFPETLLITYAIIVKDNFPEIAYFHSYKGAAPSTTEFESEPRFWVAREPIPDTANVEGADLEESSTIYPVSRLLEVKKRWVLLVI